MSEPVTEGARPAPQKTSFWEDVIDIFFSPVAVFRRRASSNPFPAMLFVALSIGVIFFATFNTLEPIFTAEFNRNMTKMMAQNPQLNAEGMDRMRSIGMNFSRYGITVLIFLSMLVLGFVTWLLGKVVGATETLQGAFVITAWAYMPRIVGSVLGAVQGLLMDPSKLTSQLSISIGPARFFDADTTNPLLYQLLGRFDLITIWVTILFAIGICVIGKVSKGRAAVFGLLIWIVGALPALRQAYVSM